MTLRAHITGMEGHDKGVNHRRIGVKGQQLGSENLWS